jgi:hypothetical protein
MPIPQAPKSPKPKIRSPSVTTIALTSDSGLKKNKSSQIIFQHLTKYKIRREISGGLFSFECFSSDVLSTIRTLISPKINTSSSSTNKTSFLLPVFQYVITVSSIVDRDEKSSGSAIDQAEPLTGQTYGRSVNNRHQHLDIFGQQSEE